MVQNYPDFILQKFGFGAELNGGNYYYQRNVIYLAQMASSMKVAIIFAL